MTPNTRGFTIHRLGIPESTKHFDKPQNQKSKVTKMTANEIVLTQIISAIRGRDEQTRRNYFKNTLTPEEALILAMTEVRA